MGRFEAEPHPLLRPYVKSYWGFVRDLSQLRSFTITPDCFVELIFFVDPPFVQEPGGLAQLPVCTLIPLLREPLRLIMKGTIRCAAARFHPWVAGLIFARANVAQVQPWCDLSTHFGDNVPMVTDALRRAAWAELTALFDRALLRALADLQFDTAALAAVQTFMSHPDGTTVTATKEVAAQHGLSRRQIERQVRSLTNQSPKKLVCLTRFQFVRDSLWARPDTELHTLAIAAGYADQAHMTRDFRRYAAQSPSEFKRHCIELKTFLSAQDVAFVQDGLKDRTYTQST